MHAWTCGGNSANRWKRSNFAYVEVKFEFFLVNFNQCRYWVSHVITLGWAIYWYIITVMRLCIVLDFEYHDKCLFKASLPLVASSDQFQNQTFRIDLVLAFTLSYRPHFRPLSKISWKYCLSTNSHPYNIDIGTWSKILIFNIIWRPHHPALGQPHMTSQLKMIKS